MYMATQPTFPVAAPEFPGHPACLPPAALQKARSCVTLVAGRRPLAPLVMQGLRETVAAAASVRPTCRSQALAVRLEGWNQRQTCSRPNLLSRVMQQAQNRCCFDSGDRT
jgi:hypothetical protein